MTGQVAWPTPPHSDWISKFEILTYVTRTLAERMVAVPKRKPGMTLRAQWLGQQLRALRESTGTTLWQAGEYLQRDPSMVSRFESAEYPIRRGDGLALLDLYHVSEERIRGGLLQLSDDMWRKGWWDDYINTVDRRYIDFVWLQSRVGRLRTYSAMLVPGLLQTREYAETLIRNDAAADTPEEQIEKGIGLRMSRQQILRGEEPVGLTAVVTNRCCTGSSAARTCCAASSPRCSKPLIGPTLRFGCFHCAEARTPDWTARSGSTRCPTPTLTWPMWATSPVRCMSRRTRR